MKCPDCNSETVGVIKTDKFDTCILRWRQCKRCKMAFPTSEEVVQRADVQKIAGVVEYSGAK